MTLINVEGSGSIGHAVRHLERCGCRGTTYSLVAAIDKTSPSNLPGLYFGWFCL